MARKSPSSTALIARRRKFLKAVLAQIPFEGWTEDALAKAGKDASLFPSGIRELIEFFGNEADSAMQTRIDNDHDFARMRVRDKVAFGVRVRLEFLTPHREAVRRLMVWYALPTRIPLGLRRMSKTVDLIWRAAGDTSTDYNFYTKRLLLAAVLKTTILYWLDDETPGCSASWAFLDRRIGEVLKVGKSLSLLKEFSPSEIGDFVRRKTQRA